MNSSDFSLRRCNGWRVVLALGFCLAIVVASAGGDCRAGTTGVHTTADNGQLPGEQEVRLELIRLQHALQEDGENHRLLLQIAHVHLQLGWLYEQDERRRYHYEQLLQFAGKAVRLQPEDFQTRLLYLVARAKNIRYRPPGQQVSGVRQLKEDLEALRQNNQGDVDSLYLLSWLNFKVGRVSAFNRMFASLFFGGLPEDLTVENGIRLMEKALELRPDSPVYHYDLGLYLERTDHPQKALTCFQRARALPARSPEELVYRQRARLKVEEMQGDRLRLRSAG